MHLDDLDHVPAQDREVLFGERLHARATRAAAVVPRIVGRLRIASPPERGRFARSSVIPQWPELLAFAGNPDHRLRARRRRARAWQIGCRVHAGGSGRPPCRCPPPPPSRTTAARATPSSPTALCCAPRPRKPASPNPNAPARAATACGSPMRTCGRTWSCSPPAAASTASAPRARRRRLRQRGRHDRMARRDRGREVCPARADPAAVGDGEPRPARARGLVSRGRAAGAIVVRRGTDPAGPRTEPAGARDGRPGHTLPVLTQQCCAARFRWFSRAQRTDFFRQSRFDSCGPREWCFHRASRCIVRTIHLRFEGFAGGNRGLTLLRPIPVRFTIACGWVAGATH